MSVIVRTRHQRIITMPFGKEPEWLAPQYRDNYVERCIQLVQKMIACEGCRKRRLMLMEGLRKYQRGNFSAFPAGTMSQLDSNCSFTASTIPNLNEFSVEPTDAFTGARLHSDGDWYSNAQNTPSFGASDGTWQGSCPLSGYETRWTRVSGDIPNSLVSGSDGVWSASTISKAVGYSITGSDIMSGSFTMECRDAASLNVLFVDSFLMDCEVDPRN
jgi:hypothetical protein